MRLLVLFSLLLWTTLADAGMVERCTDLAPEVRTYHRRELGIDYPWKFALAQLGAESKCVNRISLDGVGSEGLPQITYRVWRDTLSAEGISDLKTEESQLRAQAIINRDIWAGVSRVGMPRLWIAFQEYNGGPLVRKEVRRAGSLKYEDWKKVCQRKDVRVSPTQTRNACDINGSYSVEIFRISKELGGTEPSTTFPFW